MWYCWFDLIALIATEAKRKEDKTETIISPKVANKYSVSPMIFRFFRFACASDYSELGLVAE